MMPLVFHLKNLNLAAMRLGGLPPAEMPIPPEQWLQVREVFAVRVVGTDGPRAEDYWRVTCTFEDECN